MVMGKCTEQRHHLKNWSRSLHEASSVIFGCSQFILSPSRKISSFEGGLLDHFHFVWQFMQISDVIIQQIVTMPIYGKEALNICQPT